ncbi:UPF0135 protein [Fibrisoma limi BUZ 3]|uniref:UPF0135 protein n=1 Tax=Fibrisoma limi BUZ 3 TaxID=1185876 RepID=I2GCP2_9BACT|nr:Nif3-like dinuclear metal center hexameric protein [Fibrisoma limi]CCH51666.1 UPF0135 protein [Fibrisoma limi BUZ 3]
MELREFIAFLDQCFATDRYAASEQGGIYWPAKEKADDLFIKRIGLALEPWPGIYEWIVEKHLDVLWLHRPWKLEIERVSHNVSVLYHHLPFDETLTMGYNLRLAQTLKMSNPEEIGYKQTVDLPRRAIGMLGQTPMADVIDWSQMVEGVFGGYDQVHQGSQPGIGRIAIVGAMNEALIREAADRGAGLYLTGEYRKSAQTAVEETGISVIAVGHRRSEEWGLRALADLLREQREGVVVYCPNIMS